MKEKYQKILKLLLASILLTLLLIPPHPKTAFSAYQDSAQATIIIGSPPTTNCAFFILQGSWSSTETSNISQICSALNKAPNAITLLQKAGIITLERVPNGSLGQNTCGTVNGANLVKVGCDVSKLSLAEYVIIHELGHVLGNYNTSVYQNFLNSGAYQTEGLMPTYVSQVDSPDESFAESFSDYVVSKTYNFLSRSWSSYPGGAWVSPGPGWTTFPKDRPQHYNFFKNNIFNGVEF